MNTLTEFFLHVASVLAIVGLLPWPIDARIGTALLHSLAVMYLQSRWPFHAWRYLLLSSSALAVAYAAAMYAQGPAKLLAKTFGIAAMQPLANSLPSAGAPNWAYMDSPTKARG
ncbi:hypothetical protein EIP75_23870 [Aquabacterium soli]|uniref:Uncharacterized protein n=1 Tax=Aquabacterium soli TaxID=2493092 RepID=A0A3R8YJ07_9BURK|nr:hypothetical protein [Aquabacterium soli]RRR98930.1 hypothetical protein EIP75_23870 [Aquabacterium soli]